MGRRPITVNKFNEIKRLKDLGLSERQIARALGSSRKTIKKYLSERSITSPITNSITLWPNQLNWEEVRDEHSIGGVSLNVLWEELRASNKVPVSYSAFWKQYQRRYESCQVTMARIFEPGDRIEIDYCDGIEIFNPSTGEIQKTHLFVGVLCYSRYTFAEFSLTQNSCDFLNSHVRMFKFFGGVPNKISPDNLKSAVIKTNRYDPDINPAYSKLAEHYNIVVEPARVRRPKDKAIVERTIQIFQRWFFMKVRKKTFTSIVELNKELKDHLDIFNSKIHRILKCSRAEKFNEEKSYLRDLASDYLVQTHKRCTLHSDCHIEFENNYYSAPWKLRGEKLDVWATENQIKIHFEGDCVAIHQRKKNRGKFSTNKDHYPPNHQAYLEITPSWIREKARGIGPKTLEVINELIPEDNPLKNLRRAQGLVSLHKKFSSEELEFGCEKALLFNRFHLKFIEQVIRARREMQTPEEQIQRTANLHLRRETLLQ